MDLEQGLAKLREPFPKSAVGKLPRGGTQLDYVGHAAVTDRLLEVDPHWSWEPLAMDPEGLPLIRLVGKDAVMWVRLTVCGVTRLGVGTAPSNGFDLHKQLISDAIRNAAMRFGVALDLWTKDELESQIAPPEPAQGAAPSMRPKDHRRVENIAGITGLVKGFNDTQKAAMAAARDVNGWPDKLADYDHGQARQAFAEARRIAEGTDSPQIVESMTQEGAADTEMSETSDAVADTAAASEASVSPPAPEMDGAYTTKAVRGITHAQIDATARSLHIEIPSGSVLVRMDALAKKTDLPPGDLLGLVKTIAATKEKAEA